MMLIRKRNRLIITSLLVLSMISFTACGSKSTTNGNASSKVAQKTITFAYWGAATENAAIKSVVDNFQKNNKNITVVSQWVQNNYLTKLQTMIAGGTEPDVMLIAAGDLPGFVNAFTPMNVDSSKFASPSFADALKYDGKSYATPFIVKPKVMAINVNLFTKNNIPLPSKTVAMTPQQFQEIAMKITSGTGNKKIFGSEPLWLGNWMYSLGGSYYINNGTKSNLSGSKSLAAANFVVKSKQLGYTPDNTEIQGQSMMNWFLSGRLGMYTDFGPWYLPQMADVKGFKWDIVPFPGNGGNKEVDGLAISKTSKNAEAAQTFVNYLSENTNSQSIIGGNKIAYGIPVIAASTSAFKNIYPDENLDAFISASQKQTSEETQKRTSEIGNVLNDINNDTLIGIGTKQPSEVFPQLDKRIDIILQEK